MYDTNYWYFRDSGKPTYAQNHEGWAEYYSSQLCGHNRENNLNDFPVACEIMDEMAHELLDAYKEKHRIQ